MLKVEKLTVEVGQQKILNDLNISIEAGKVHAIMGPNGSGKSTLSKVLMGDEAYKVISGNITYKNQDLLAMSPQERSHAGLFLGFQYPVAIPGVNNMTFLKTALNAKLKALGKSECDAMSFMSLAKNAAKVIDMDLSFLKRDLNDDFSGGEKKRNEILQMLVLKPDFAILDEIDSGLDIDALQSVAKGINSLKQSNNSMLLITHYPRLLDLIKPDVVHIMVGGKIVKTGPFSLASEVEKQGYSWVNSSIVE
jgi:Fe-S cluster assembly ATP-binding protein